MAMKVALTEKEIKCNEYREKFKKNWEFYCLTGDAYSQGFQDALVMAQEFTWTPESGRIDLSFIGTKEVEVEFKDGDHQIGEKSNE